jgi:hypothetical protein
VDCGLVAFVALLGLGAFVAPLGLVYHLILKHHRWNHYIHCCEP